MKKIQLIILLLLSSIVLLNCNLQKNNEFELQKGDLLFQDLDSDEIDSAIESVTGENSQLSFSHVGIVDVNTEQEVFVLEAISKGVCYTPLQEFLKRSETKDGKSKVLVGRLHQYYQNRIEPAMQYGKKLLGASYDSVYVMGDSSYYCSELIYEMFAKTDSTEFIFELNPMTFRDPKTGETLAFWKHYYQQKNRDIPEGKPGLNPNGMSKSEKIKMVHSFLE